MRIRTFFPLFAALAVIIAVALPARAADRDRLEAFLETTGFDAALESIRLSASSAPGIIGMEAQDFGLQWTLLVEEIFAPELMHDMALDMLEETLSDDLLDHAVAFYETDLGRRLVAAENASHLKEDEAAKDEAGKAIIAGLEAANPARIALLHRMNDAADASGNALKFIREVQVRFLMAAAAAGVIELQMDEPDLRALLAMDQEELRDVLRQSSLEGAAYTYQAFSDAEVETYAEALENPRMQEVYELMNAVQFAVMADRFEALALRMGGLQPSQDL